MSYQIQIECTTASTASHEGVRVAIETPSDMALAQTQGVMIMEELNPARVAFWGGGDLPAGPEADHYRQRLTQHLDRLVPLLQLARQGPIVLLHDRPGPAPAYLAALRDLLIEQLQLEDLELSANEASSPTCYLDTTHLK